MNIQVAQGQNILLVDDQRYLLDILSADLRKEGHKVKCVRTIDEALRRADGEDNPSLVLASYLSQAPVSSNKAAEIVQAFTPSPVAFYTAPLSLSIMQNMLDSGIRGYIPKTADAKTLVSAINVLLFGSSYIPQDVVLSKRKRLEPHLLTQAEHDILELVSVGQSNKEIALALALSESTVKMRVRSIAMKFGVRNRTEVVLHALKNGLVHLM